MYDKDKEMLSLIRTQVTETDANIKLMNASFDKVNKEIAVMAEQLETLKIDNFIRRSTQDDVIKEIRARSNISEAEAKAINEKIAIELKHGHLSNRGLDITIWQLATEKALREAGLAVEWQNRMNSAIAEGHEIDAREVFGQMMKKISPEQAKRVIAHQTSLLGDLTYYASEVAQPLIQLVPRYSKSTKFQSQDNRGNSVSSSSNINFSW